MHEIKVLNPLVEARMKEIRANRILDTAGKIARLMNLIDELPKRYQHVRRIYEEIEYLRIDKDVNVYKR